MDQVDPDARMGFTDQVGPAWKLMFKDNITTVQAVILKSMDLEPRHA